MKKIGVVNFHYSNNNYGAVLQAAAIASILEQKGFDAEHIDYIPYENTKRVPLKIKIRHLIILFLDIIKVKSIIKKLRGDKIYIKDDVCGNQIFEDFRNKWIKRTEETYHSSDNLAKIENDYDAIIVGSDQVWRPRMYVNPYSDVYAYFLQFAGSKTKKISYAASFGVERWETSLDDLITRDVTTAISSFDSISVREKSGVSICSEQFNVEATHVIDPTLLAGTDFFNKVIEEANIETKSDNLVYYKLDSNKLFLNRISQIANSFNVDIENIYYNSTPSGYEYNSVPLWLSKIKNSKLVVTDSFHCVCLAILFEKDFICIGNSERGLARLKSLLSQLNIEDRLIEDEIDFAKTYFKLESIDYENVNQILCELRISSSNFLFKALG
ncbi:polysaccharide pyruvyl transferase family protein [uncultured Shewanella sp.]|uniref:polysaccharide pyruvyl transferase family protein n=1 Tax=uncultured Shewanella sp. TaxID=173975 RepID=UPI00260454C7|nr:polysaccharide pyruvyl transferase family protein [uncultured Shewanella sp.]